ncbi:hypothetical protein GCM10027440_26420 [Nocardiopsis coralliicola]
MTERGRAPTAPAQVGGPEGARTRARPGANAEYTNSPVLRGEFSSLMEDSASTRVKRLVFINGTDPVHYRPVRGGGAAATIVFGTVQRPPVRHAAAAPVGALRSGFRAPP